MMIFPLLQGRKLLDIDYPVGPFGTKVSAVLTSVLSGSQCQLIFTQSGVANRQHYSVSFFLLLEILFCAIIFE